MNTGERIKTARKQAGLTQKELGEVLGVSFQAVAQWETGRRVPKLPTLKNIANALGVFVTDLTGDSGGPVFESNLERAAYRLNKKIKNTEAAIYGKYIDDKYNVWLRFSDHSVVALDADELCSLEQQIDRYAAFSLEEFKRTTTKEKTDELPAGVVLPGWSAAVTHAEAATVPVEGAEGKD